MTDSSPDSIKGLVESVHPALSVQWLRANPRCEWIKFSKAKRGPKVRWWCKFCQTFSRARKCPMEAEPNG